MKSMSSTLSETQYSFFFSAFKVKLRTSSFSSNKVGFLMENADLLDMS